MAQTKITEAWIRTLAIHLLRKTEMYKAYQDLVEEAQQVYPHGPWRDVPGLQDQWVLWTMASDEYYRALGNRLPQTHARIESYMRLHRDELMKELSMIDCFMTVELL